MGKKQSSFHMGNEFNGYGETTYLKATECGIHPPLSQENVQLSPDFRNCLLKLLGSVPVVMDPANMNPILLSLLGSMASVNQTIMTKDESTGNYIIQFNVMSQNFTDGAYPHYYQIMNNEVPAAMGIPSQWVEFGIPKGAKWKYYQIGKFLENSWVKSKGKWYYLGSDQYMVTGWKKIDGNWYYFKSKIEDGKETAGYMVTHWNMIKGKWYYFHSSGEMMASNWAQDEAKKHWYYCGSDGVMVTSSIIDWKGKKYFVEEDGAMAVNKTIVDPDSGKTYKADGDGVLTEVAGNAGIQNVTFTSVDISKFSAQIQNEINELLKAYDSSKDDWYKEYLIDSLENIINYATSGYGQAIEEFKIRANGVITGTLQGVGGYTEMITGAAIFGGTSWTGIGIPVGVAGGYMAVDGASNLAGGASKAFNAAIGDNEGDTWNFMKQAYKKISPEYGESIYNCTQIAIGIYTIGKGIKELPESAVQTFNRSKNIIRAQNEGLEVGTEIMDVGSKVVIVDKTQSGMILRKVVVNKSALTSGMLLIGVDAYNASSSADSIN